MFAFLPSRGRPWLRPQNEVGKRGLIRQIRAIGRPAWGGWRRFADWRRGLDETRV